MYNNNTCPIKVPGFWNNGDCALLCRKAEWYDMLLFFFGNYLAHVATVTTRPGEPLLLQALYLSSALFSPLTGLNLGWIAIRSRAVFASTPLRAAARAGALCTVVPDVQDDTGVLRPFLNGDGGAADAEDGYAEGMQTTGVDAANSVRSIPRSRSHMLRDEQHAKRPWTHAQYHGENSLPPGYTLILVPWDAEFDNDTPSTSPWWNKPWRGFQRTKNPPIELACNSNYVKAAVSVAQIVFGAVTIYRTRGNQIEKYGYAAFGLSVTPYVWMSLINLVGNIVRPSYPALYITDSKWLEEAKGKSASWPGLSTIGRLSDSSADKAHDRLLESVSSQKATLEKRRALLKKYKHVRGPWAGFVRGFYRPDGRMFSVERHPDDIFDSQLVRMERKSRPLYCILLIVGPISALAVPLIVTGTLSGFATGESSMMQRFWIMAWLLLGSLVPFAWVLPRASYESLEMAPILGALSLPVAMAVAAVGGFCVVARMFGEHGVCFVVPDK